MPSAAMKVMLDTNVALDLLQERQPFVADALHVFALGEAGKVELLLSTDAISTIFSIVGKNKNAAIAREAVAKLLDFVSLVSLDEHAVLRGMSLDFEDVEDALVAAVAGKEQASVIVTRNEKDFKNSPVPVQSPAAFLAFYATLAKQASS